MLITCDNKGCLQSTNAKLKVDTMEVICMECKNTIHNIAETMKRVLKSSGQIIRDDAVKAFTMGCKGCNANRQIVLNENDETVCSVCGNVVNVHSAMKQAIVEAGIRLKKITNIKKTTKKKK